MALKSSAFPLATTIHDGMELRFASSAFRLMSRERFATFLDGLWDMRE